MKGLRMSENVKRKPQLSIPVSSDLQAKVELAAERERRSVASYARNVLASAVEQQNQGEAA
jgi:hypothetical protein